MAILPTRPEDAPSGRGHDETADIARHFERTLNRVLDFLGYSIDDVVNDARKKRHVARAYLISRRVDRDLEEETWHTEATERLGEYLGRRLAPPERLAEGEGK